jgi:hypothetical protein
MKSILPLLVIANISISSLAQDAKNSKIRAGLAFNAGMNFQELKTNNFRSGGVGSEFMLGMNLNFNFNETIGFSTGTEFDFSNTKYEPSGLIYYRYNDTEILRKVDIKVPGSYSVFQLDSRKDKSIFLSIPTMLLFQTKFIGYFRYFGKFGLRHSFLLNSESDDKGTDYTPNSENTNNNMTTKSNMFFYKGAIGMACGAEWNFSGSTSLIGELGYYYGITPLYWERSADSDKLSLFSINSNKEEIYSPIKARQNQLLLKLSVLF